MWRFSVWLACSIGLFAADIIGMLVGYLLKNKMPEGVLNSVAFCIFFVFGILTLREGLEMLLGAGNVWVIGTTVAAAVIFAIVCLGLYRKKKAAVKQSFIFRYRNFNLTLDKLIFTAYNIICSSERCAFSSAG